MITAKRAFAKGQYLLRNWNGLAIPSGFVEFSRFVVEPARLVRRLRRQNRGIAQQQCCMPELQQGAGPADE
jgi:hypothetical protein